MDIGMLWENKYDINILAGTIKDNKHYNPKEKENMIYVGPIQRQMEGFLAVIDFLQEREYGLDDLEKGKVKKMYAYHSIPHLLL